RSIQIRSLCPIGKRLILPLVQGSFSHGKLLLSPARSSHALRSERSLLPPESQWSQALYMKIFRCYFCSYDQSEQSHSDIFPLTQIPVSSVDGFHLPGAYLLPLRGNSESDLRLQDERLSAGLPVPDVHLTLST